MNGVTLALAPSIPRFRCRHDVLDPTPELVIEIAREGRESRRVGTLSTPGKTEGLFMSSAR